MEKNQLDEYRKKLENERRLLLLEIAQHEKPASFGTDTEDPDEGTDESEEVGNRLAMAQDLKNRLDEVDVALSKIQNGKYGICEKCGKGIESAVLAIDPESRFCKTCKLRA